MKNHFFVLFILILIFNLSCIKNKDTKIQLPETKNLDLMYQWAYIKENLIPRLKMEPNPESKVVSYLKEGALLKILKKDTKLSELDNEIDYWYFVDYEGEQGWIFGSFIEIYNNKEETIKECEQMLLNKKQDKNQKDNKDQKK